MSGEARAATYLAARPVRYALTARTIVCAPIADVFDFFAQPQNLGLMTPASMGFLITSISGPMQEGALISYRLRVGGVPVKWQTRIDVWDPGRRFVDAQIAGPYASWWHEHRFEPCGAHQTIMHDRVWYAPPLGIVGRLANHLFIKDALRDIFAFRADAIRLRFGEPSAVDLARTAP